MYILHSDFYGVEFTRDSRSSKWIAYVDLPGSKHIIGRYDTKKAAALHYNALAKCLKRAHLNDVEDTEIFPNHRVLSSDRNVKSTNAVSTLPKVYADCCVKVKIHSEENLLL